MNIAEIRRNSQPFFLEYQGDSIAGRYRLALITPDWQAKIQGDEDQSPLKIVDLVCEVVSEWDLEDEPIPYESGGTPGAGFAVGDVISYQGAAYRVLDHKEEEGPGDGSPGKLPARGERSWYGPFELENVGPANALYGIPLNNAQVRRLPSPMLEKVLDAVMLASRGDVDDAKKGG